MASSPNKRASKAKAETFDGEPAPDDTGRAVTTPMVMFAASVRVSGPDYVVEEGESAPIPSKYAKGHVKDGHGVIVGEEIVND